MRFIIDLAIPVLLLLVGIAGKRVTAGGEWDWEFGCLGPDLLLCGFGAELAYLCDFGKKLYAATAPTLGQSDGKKLIFDAAFLVVGIVFLVFAWLDHRLPPVVSGSPRLPRVWTGWTKFRLAFVWNLIGIAILLGFLMLIKVD